MTLLLGLWVLVLLLAIELAEGLLTQVEVEFEVEKVVAVEVEMEEEEGEWMCLDEGLAFDFWVVVVLVVGTRSGGLVIVGASPVLLVC